MITYNHVRFIEQAIQGVIHQKLSFPWEFIIADDFSTDGTRAIVQTYGSQFPNNIRLVLQQKNVGPSKNWFDLISAANGKYIAYFEGDDYWTDPNKLQRQVDFLETNPDYAFCFHQVNELIDGKLILSKFNDERFEKTYTIEDLSKGNFIHTPSVVYRKVFEEFPKWFADSPVGDYPLYLLLARHGKIKFFPEPMAVYRRNVGVWSTLSEVENCARWITVLDLLMQHFQEDREIINGLAEQKRPYVDKIVYLARESAQEANALKNDVASLAKMIPIKKLSAALGIALKNKFRSNA